MNHPEITLILARAHNGVIGNGGQLPWQLPADLRRFKQLTMGAPMIMGRKTYESLPGILPGRRHIVLTRNAAWDDEGAEVARSVEDALTLANAPHVAVIGGAEIYKLFVDRADKIELTEIDLSPQGDTVLPAFDPAIWIETVRESHAADGARPAYNFVTLVRRK